MFRREMWLSLVLVLGGLMTASCSNDDGFTQTATTEFFTQDYNPEMIDVLWVIDDRSQMSFYQSANQNLVEQARQFFIRLDSVASRQYRMALVNLDDRRPGLLRPDYNPVILTKNLGTVSERADYFRSIFGQVLNLKTGADNHGFANAYAALTSSFVPKANIPLVVVFLSDGDDTSPSSSDAVEQYASLMLATKQNRTDLLRVYSINYKVGGDRCFTKYSANIDQAGFQDRYYRLADRLGGSKGDICASWATQIDLSGLRLKELPKRFKLAISPKPETIQISVLSQTQVYQTIPSRYEEATNEIVFDAAPPEGSTISVTYHPK